MSTPWEKKNAFRVRKALGNTLPYEDCLQALRASRDACPARDGEEVSARTTRILEHAVESLRPTAAVVKAGGVSS